MTPKKKKRRRGQREALVFRHLERVSRTLFEKHPDIVRNFIGRNAGVYALYREDQLYYVGLATGLANRLKSHGKNRHGNSWDRFSIYLTIKDQHLRELEALLLRIVSPKGNKQRGKLHGSKDMRGQIGREIRKKQSAEMSAIFQRLKEVPALRAKAERLRSTAISKLLPNGARLRGTNKRVVYRARAYPDGRIKYNGSYYSSLSDAASAALKRPVNGWWFWTVQRGPGHWERLTKIRKIGTPLDGR